MYVEGTVCQGELDSNTLNRYENHFYDSRFCRLDKQELSTTCKARMRYIMLVSRRARKTSGGTTEKHHV